MATTTPPADLLPVTPHANLLFRLLRLAGGCLLRLMFRFQVSGLQNMRPGRSHIVVGNHLGWLDWASMLMFLPAEPRLHFLADPEGLVRRPLEWWLVRHTGGYVPVSRGRHGDPALFRHVRRCLEVGGSVAIFPEGEFGPEEGTILAFKMGFAHFAIESGVPVLPVGLSGTKEPWLGKRLGVAVGRPIDPSGYTPDTLTRLAAERVAALIPAYREPPGHKPLRKWLTKLF